MSTIVESGITIEISGPEDSGKTLVGSICHKALTKAGFTSITMTDQQGEIVEPYEPQTVFDLIIARRPELFNTPIAIVEVTDTAEEAVEVVELSDMTLRIGGEDDVETPDPMTEAMLDLRGSDEVAEASEFDA